ncbi:MAG: PD-(D/E)XK nuclease family protein [Thermofilum sp.]
MKLRISPTALAMWDDCQLKFFYRVNEVEPLKTPETEDIIVGRDIHEIIRDYYLRLIGKDYEMTEFEIRATLIELAEKRMLMPILETESDDYVSTKFKSCLSNFVKVELERMRKFGGAKLLCVEEKAEKSEVMDNHEVVWTGVIDAVWYNDGLRIGYDWKTGYRHNVITKPMIYQAMLYRHIYNLDKFYFVFLTKGVLIEVKEIDFDLMREKVREIISVIEAGELEPNEKSCDTCEYNLPCKVWSMGVDLTNY